MTGEQQPRPTDFPWWASARPPLQAWECEGILCAISTGYVQLNGYARVPENHPWRTRFTAYSDLPVEVHGGLTFGPQDAHEELKLPGSDGPGLPAREAITWEERLGWIGFDTGHVFDYWPDEELAKVGLEISGEWVRFRQLIKRDDPRFQRLWTVDDLIQEVNDLARQVAAAAHPDSA